MIVVLHVVICWFSCYDPPGPPSAEPRALNVLQALKSPKIGAPRVLIMSARPATVRCVYITVWYRTIDYIMLCYIMIHSILCVTILHYMYGRISIYDSGDLNRQATHWFGLSYVSEGRPRVLIMLARPATVRVSLVD